MPPGPPAQPPAPTARHRARGFVGRASELEALRGAFDRGERLVTLWGPGGIGKTSLCRELMRGEPPGSVLFCDLTEARSALDVHAALAAVLALPFAGLEVSADVLRALAGRGSLLVVLDNFEQVADFAVETVGRWLEATTTLRALVTSRERLRLQEEHCIELGPLLLPDAGESDPLRIAESDAVQLFVERGRAIRGDFAPSDAELAAVAALVRRVDGIPLAIELCAARLAVVGTRELLDLLATGLGVLRNDRRAGPSRHATLRDAITWSWDLLSAREQRALAQCSVFRGGFGLEAATAVLDVAQGDAHEARELAVLEVLQELRERSLIRSIDVLELPGERRFVLYETVRELASERLRDEGAETYAATYARHARHYCASGAKLARAVYTRVGVDARRRLALERDNLLAIAERALARAAGSAQSAEEALAALSALEPVTVGCAGMPLAAYVELLDAALSVAARDTSARAAALIARGSAALVRGRFDEAAADYQHALVMAQSANDMALAMIATVQHAGLQTMRLQAGPLGHAHARVLELVASDPRRTALLVASEAVALLRADRLPESRRAALEARAQLAAAGDVHNEGMISALLGHVAIELGALDEGERENTRALVLLRTVAERRLEAPVTANLGRIAQARGDLDAAATLFERATTLGAGVSHRWLEGLLLAHVGGFELERGDATAASRAFVTAAAAFDDVDDAAHRAECEAGAAVADAMNGDVDSALARLARAEASTDVRTTTRAIVRLRRGLVELARARCASSLAIEAEHRAAALAHLEGARALETLDGVAAREVSETARQAERLLMGAPAAIDRPEITTTLAIGSECRWFAVDGGPRVDLSRRRALRLVLRALAERHARSREALDVDALFVAGWPGERARGASAANRVYVTLSKLRALGLRSVLETRDDGVLLRSDVRLVCEGERSGRYVG